MWRKSWYLLWKRDGRHEGLVVARVESAGVDESLVHACDDAGRFFGYWTRSRFFVNVVSFGEAELGRSTAYFVGCGCGTMKCQKPEYGLLLGCMNRIKKERQADTWHI